VRVADYTAACAEAEDDGVSAFVRVLHDAGVRPAEASTLAQALTSRSGGGQLGVSGRSRGVVNWLDTDDGRYALRRNGEWITITAADTSRLTSMAEEMLADFR
jgi:hypothetical protein